MQATHRIAIIGGGFAGATLARDLARGLPEGWEVLLARGSTCFPAWRSTQCP